MGWKDTGTEPIVLGQPRILCFLRPGCSGLPGFLSPPYVLIHMHSSFFYFLLGPFLKSLLSLSQYYFCFTLGYLGHKAYRILAPWPGIKPSPLALEGEVLTTGPPGKSPIPPSFECWCLLGIRFLMSSLIPGNIAVSELTPLEAAFHQWLMGRW